MTDAGPRTLHGQGDVPTSGGTPSVPAAAALLLLAAALTLMGAVRPLHMDEPYYFALARQMARHPLDPYGGTTLWGNPQDILAPPLAPAWTALGLRLWGDSELAAKLWLLPFNLLLTGALWQLYRRVARPPIAPLAGMTVLSAILLPVCGLMLEVPTLALSLTALLLFMGACDRRSWARALLAGVILGLAMQTKYTAWSSLLTIGAYGIIMGHKRAALLAILLAVLVFVGWEACMWALYGQTHLVRAGWGLHHRAASARFPGLALSLLATVGGTFMPLALLAASVLKAWRRWFLVLVGAAAGGYIVLVLVPQSAGALIHGARPERTVLTVNNVVFGVLAVINLTAFGTAGAVLVRRLRTRGLPSVRPPQGRMSLFLATWFVIELAGYFVLVPIPSVRRLMVLYVVGLALAAHQVGRYGPRSRRRAATACAAVFAVVLGLLYWTTDARENWTALRAIQTTAQKVHMADPAARVWLVAPINGLYGTHLRWRLIRQLDFYDPWPFSTRNCYWSARTPIERRDGPRFSLALYEAGVSR